MAKPLETQALGACSHCSDSVRGLFDELGLMAEGEHRFRKAEERQ